ncbi:uncharacterized protein LOC143483313 [Brachyhypopomus gauderio]|uniref:uncharacterized protein LOC143483313 n=1 Tax=Brachyhypopomus gauderio TaxID=698409 RepID=UPI00404101BC
MAEKYYRFGQCSDMEDNKTVESIEDDLEGLDIQVMTSQRKEEPFSQQLVKQLDKGFSKKLKTVDRQFKSVKLSRTASQRGCYTGKMLYPTERDGTVPLTPSHRKMSNHKHRSRWVVSGHANKVNYIPLEASTSRTEEDSESLSSAKTGDGKEIRKQAKNKFKIPKRFCSLTRTMSGLLKSITKDQAVDSSE